MKHRVGYNRLGRKTAHRLSLHRNMATSLLRHERITTTKAKALAVRRTVEKMITRAKSDSVHNRRIIGKDIKDKEILAKLFTDIGPRFSQRPGGYTRILKIGQRKGDAAQMVILELVEKKEDEKEKKPSKARKKKEETKSESAVKKSTVKSAGKELSKEETAKVVNDKPDEPDESKSEDQVSEEASEETVEEAAKSEQ